MTAPLSTQKIPLARHHCRYSLPTDLIFEGLAVPQGAEIVRLRFSRGSGTSVDVPLSTESLAVLVGVMSSLNGFPAERMAEAIDYLRRNNGILE